MNRQRKLAEEPKIDQIKAVNKGLAADVEAHKKREAQMTQLKDEITRERSVLTEQNVRMNTCCFAAF